jgi:hypothetical protein
MLHGAIFLATCNAILLLRDVKLPNTSLHYTPLMVSQHIENSSLISLINISQELVELHCKLQEKLHRVTSAAQDIIFPIYFAAGYFFLPLIITAYSRLSYSYHQRRSRGFQSEEAENWIPRGAQEFSLCFILYGYVLMFPTLKRAGLLTKNV